MLYNKSSSYIMNCFSLDFLILVVTRRQLHVPRSDVVVASEVPGGRVVQQSLLGGVEAAAIERTQEQYFLRNGKDLTDIN